MRRHLLAAFVLLAVVAACSPAPPPGFSPGGSGGFVDPGGRAGSGGSGGAGGTGGATGGTGGATGGTGGATGGTGGGTGGSGGAIEEPPCPDPDDEVLCWALGEGAWETAPGYSFTPGIAVAAVAKPGQIPATTLAWTDCGPGCSEASTALFDRDDEGTQVGSLAVYADEDGPMALANIRNVVRERGLVFTLVRTVNLEDGATLAALRCVQIDGEDQVTRCSLGGGHPLHVTAYAYRRHGGENPRHTAATYQPAEGRFVFRQPWSEDADDACKGCSFEVLPGPYGPIPLVTWPELSVLPHRDALTRSTIWEGRGVVAVATEGDGVAWTSRDGGPWSWYAWTLGGEVTATPLPASAGTWEPVAIGLGASRTVFALRAPDGTGAGAHRLLWARRDRSTVDERLDAPLFHGEPLRLHGLVATDDHAVAVVERTPTEEHRPEVVVVPRADGRARVVRPITIRWSPVLAVSGDTLWLIDPVESDGPVRLYRHDLARLPSE